MEFTEEQWQGLKQHADEHGLIFLSSPFSFEAVDLLSRVGVAAWKIPSGETTSTPILDQILATGLPVILSTGMSPLSEIDKTVKRIKKSGVPLVLLQCTTAYPCPPEKVGINMISFFKERYKCAVGLSDHSGTIYPGLAAAAFGMHLLEVHVTFNRAMFGPDVPASVTMDELSKLVEGIRFIEKMMANPVDKEAIAGEFNGLRDMFTKSIVARKDLKIGTLLKADDLSLKKPGTGIPASRLPEIIGRRLKRSLTADTLISESDLE
jgi:N-acetylneuraminate synthase